MGLPPTRRDLLHGLAASTAASLGTAQAQQSRRPNILFVFSDQHRACSMPGEQYNDAAAPTLAKLAAQGTTFTQCISNYPVCSPYRGILMTGRWPYQTGIIDNAFPLRQSEFSLGEAFERAGYHTGYVGKWHLDARGTEGLSLKPEGEGRHGFTEWHGWYGTNDHQSSSTTFDPVSGKERMPPGYNATNMTHDAVSFVERNRSQPWMLILSWNPPHPPYDDAPADLKKKYPDGDMQLRPNSVATVQQGVGRRVSEIRTDLTGYNAHIEGIDIEMARLLRTLDETGQADNTIVVYTSDHGEMMGSHNRTGKRVPHEESCKVPFIVRAPGTQLNRKTDAMLGAIDIYPTLCGLAGIPVPATCMGQDLSGVIRGENIQGPEHQFLMHIAKSNARGGANHPAPIYRGIRTKRHTYACGEIGRWCLYDNQEDPFQQHNLADDQPRAKLMAELDGEVLDYLRAAHDSYPYRIARD